MQVILKPIAEKQHERLNEPHKSRISRALMKLENDPPEGNIKKLQGRDSYRLAVGDYRVLFDIINNDPIIISVYKIGPRGDVYKK